MVVICLCHNQVEVTKQFVESVGRAGDSLDGVKIVMVDNGSSDGTEDYLKGLETPFVCRRNDTNKWFTVAVDEVIADYPGEDVYLINNDIIVKDGWLSGRVVLKDYGLLACTQLMPIEERMITFMGGRDDFMGHKEGWDWAEPKDIHEELWVSFGACMINRAVLDKVGGLDRSLKFYCSDSDLSLRVKAAGYKVAVSPFMRVIHLGGFTTQRMSNEFKASVWEDSDQRRFAKKHGLKVMNFDYRGV